MPAQPASISGDPSSSRCRSTRRIAAVAGQVHRDAEPAGGAGGEGEGSVVRLGDAVDDCQAEADTRVVGAYAFGAALKRLDERGNQLWGEHRAGAFDSEHHSVTVNAGRYPHVALFLQVV